MICVVNDEVPLTSSQIIEQIEIIQEAVLSGLPKHNNSTLNKKQENQTQVYRQKYSQKRKMDLILPIIFAITLNDGSWYRVIDSPVLQELFSSVPKYSSWNSKKKP